MLVAHQSLFDVPVGGLDPKPSELNHGGQVSSATSLDTHACINM